MVMSRPKIFFLIFSKKCCFFRKNVTWENIQNLISHKRGYIHFCRQMPPSLQKRLRPPKRFFAVFSENYSFFFFLKKQLNNKIFDTSFAIKKVMLIFGARRLPYLKICQMRLQNSFSPVFQKILLFSKNLF